MPDIPPWQSRTALLFGEDAVTKLASANVLAVGLGGVGGIAVEMIARAGVGFMTLADGDTVDDSNRNRQIPALTSTVGRKKTDVMAERLRDINPGIILRTADTYLTEDDMAGLLDSGHFDCVLDAIDTVAPKCSLIRQSLLRKIPVVSCMGAGAKLNPELIRTEDFSKTRVCSLARALRQRLRSFGIEGGFPAVFSTEPPIRSAVRPDADAGPDKRCVTGTISYMPAVFGCHCAAAVIRELLKK